MAMSHPTRLHALTFLAEKPASPKEIADRLGLPVNNVAHHIGVLHRLGCIELISTTPAHGGRVATHRYQATQKAYVDAEAWEAMGDGEKLQLTANLMRLISGDVAEAMYAGTFYDPDDNHLSRSPMVLDLEGWNEVITLLDGTAGELDDIQSRVNERIEDVNQETMLVKVAILQFRSPDNSKNPPSP